MPVSPLRCLALAVAAALGCGDPGYPRVPISGTVTLDGRPLAAGTIVFEPKGPLPTQAGGAIRDGRFDILRENGPVPGSYAVAVFGGPVDPQAAAAFEGAAVSRSDPLYAKLRDVVPPRFNRSTTLTAEVRPDGENAFRFDLTSDPKAK